MSEFVHNGEPLIDWTIDDLIEGDIIIGVWENSNGIDNGTTVYFFHDGELQPSRKKEKPLSFTPYLILNRNFIQTGKRIENPYYGNYKVEMRLKVNGNLTGYLTLVSGDIYIAGTVGTLLCKLAASVWAKFLTDSTDNLMCSSVKQFDTSKLEVEEEDKIEESEMTLAIKRRQKNNND